MKKPKMYRKTKKTDGSTIADWNPSKDTGGGRVAGTIKGPLSSIGDEVLGPGNTDQGMAKGLETPSGSTVDKSVVGHTLRNRA